MKRILLILILMVPLLAGAQNIRINQLRSTGEPADRLVATDGAGSLKFTDLSAELIDSLGSGIDSIFTVIDSSFQGIEHLKYTLDDSTYTVTQIVKPDGVVFGGNVSWYHDLTFNVSATAYYLGGSFYTVLADSVVLGASDATHPRIDIIVVDTTGAIAVIEGTASATPVKPTFDPISQIELTQIYIPANATEPSGVTGLTVYNENVEWTTSATGVSVNFDGTTTPYNGAIVADIATITNLDQVTFTNTASIAHADYTVLSFAIKLKAAMAQKDRLTVYFENGTSAASLFYTPVIDKSLLTWQVISIPLPSVSWLTDSIDVVNLLFNTKTSHSGMLLDYMVIQGGIEQPDPTDLSSYWSKTEITSGDTANWNSAFDHVALDGDLSATNEIQTIDTAQLTGTDLELSLENDGEPAKVIDLSSLQDGTGTDDQTAAEVTYDNAVSGLTATDVKAALDEIDNTVDGIISTGGDNWGTDTVVHDITLLGPGTFGDEIKVDTTIIETKANAAATYIQTETDPVYSAWDKSTGISITESQISDFGTYLETEVDGSITNELITSVTYADDTLSITEAGTAHKVEIVATGGSGITELTSEVTASGTGSVAATVADNVIDYANVDETLKDTIVDNDVSWDMSAHSIIYSAVSGAIGTIAISNPQVNKTILVVLTISSFTSLTVPAEINILNGSADFADGVFYLYIHCIGTNLYTMTIIQEAT